MKRQSGGNLIVDLALINKVVGKTAADEREPLRRLPMSLVRRITDGVQDLLVAAWSARVLDRPSPPTT